MDGRDVTCHRVSPVLKQPHQRRLIKAKINGHWRFVTEFQRLPQNAIRIELDEGSFLIPAEDWQEVSDGNHQEASGSGVSGTDLARLEAGLTPARPRTRLKADPIPATQVAVSFLVLLACILVGMIVAAVLGRI